MAVKSDIRILVVDDFLPMRTVLREALEMLKFKNIDEAENGSVAYNKLDTDKFDLVISDWEMPEMNGLELLKKMKADEKHKHIPVLMVTAEAAQDHIITAVNAGAANYIVKPITVRTLMAKIEKIFKQSS